MKPADRILDALRGRRSEVERLWRERLTRLSSTDPSLVDINNPAVAECAEALLSLTKMHATIGHAIRLAEQAARRSK